MKHIACEIYKFTIGRVIPNAAYNEKNNCVLKSFYSIVCEKVLMFNIGNQKASQKPYLKTHEEKITFLFLDTVCIMLRERTLFIKAFQNYIMKIKIQTIAKIVVFQDIKFFFGLLNTKHCFRCEF